MSRSRVTSHILGDQIADEAATLLRDLKFSHECGAFARGKQVAVSVDTRWNEDGQTISMLFTCYAFGHVAVDWSHLMLFVGAAQSEDNTWVVFLNQQGQAAVASLPPSTYSVYPLSEGVVGREPQVQPVRSRDKVANRSAALRDDQRERVFTYISADGRVTATVTRSRQGQVSVVFRANAPSLVGARVSYRFVGKSGKLVKAGEVELMRLAGGEIGAELKTVTIAAPCELGFSVIRGPEAPGPKGADQ